MTTAAKRRSRRLIPTLALIGVGALALSACSSGGGSGSQKESAEFAYLSSDTNTQISTVLKIVSKNQCAAEQKAQPLKISTTPGTTVDQKLQLLAGQNALPTMSTASGTPDLMKQFIKANKIVDVTKALGSDSGSILPAAMSTIKQLYGTDDAYVFPTEFNIEGIWYNKKIFQANNIEIPKTWDELVDVSKKLNAAGVQPISTDGKDGWPITRLISGYLYRDLGTDAMQKVADGSAKLTDDEYVKAADAVAKLGADGAFGSSVGSIDYNGMFNTFLTGKAAMMYNGSWSLTNFADPKQDQIGQENIGFMPFPAVTGGKGSIDDIPSNIGIPVMFSQSKYGPKTQAWIKCIANNYGDLALANGGVVSGFKVTKVPDNLSDLTKLVQQKVSDTKSSVLWFEALFSAKRTQVSQSNAAGLVSGSLSGEQFMKLVQDAQ
ncbi:extracellular solute-binding protein [Microbacterium sp. STN6]|uniref:ABC transporter substrate-binding protein n=1 Tax=Microbacterium sp. STN6 TaxID=2995588 RepID=UPI002260BB82|nr:extracellular solute-binding protein [Microbacterium sp. STN6]MCX7522518.1 extracellular solute-binding protein [Microbacterium sp. STN6]